MIERTFSILKPDAVSRNLTGKINAMLEEDGFKIIAQKMIHMSKEKAEGFYIVHKDRPFYGELVDYMSSGPVVVQVLEKENCPFRLYELQAQMQFVIVVYASEEIVAELQALVEPY